ncbi:hypothetical protein TNCT_500961 [Trichonephila clavata]|uniref:Uncharacterized protein n=1 Tax=Trichonephila clavata TaxID=2740835 RepID=A0A8X6JZB1_TRICU|nr:hypothetical protein TNCT_500961 [Trichonephila clavata]
MIPAEPWKWEFEEIGDLFDLSSSSTLQSISDILDNGNVSSNSVYVWRMPGECLYPECILPTVKFGGVGIVVGDVSRTMDCDH